MYIYVSNKPLARPVKTNKRRAWYKFRQRNIETCRCKVSKIVWK